MSAFIGALLLVLLITTIVLYGQKKDRNFGAFGLFFLLLFLPVWAFSLWIPSSDPEVYGLAWIKIIYFTMVATFLLLAATPRDEDGHFITSKSRNTGFHKFHTTGNHLTAGMSAAFWAFLAFILVVIFLGAND